MSNLLPASDARTPEECETCHGFAGNFGVTPAQASSDCFVHGAPHVEAETVREVLQDLLWGWRPQSDTRPDLELAQELRDDISKAVATLRPYFPAYVDSSLASLIYAAVNRVAFLERKRIVVRGATVQESIREAAQSAPDCIFAEAVSRRGGTSVHWAWDGSYSRRELARGDVEGPVRKAAPGEEIDFNYYTLDGMA